MSWLTDRLSELMRQRGVAVDTLARQLGVERSRMGRIIAGSAIPNENLIKRLARYFDEDAATWLGTVGQHENGSPLAASVPADFIKVAKVSEIPDGETRIVFDNLVAVANYEGNFHAFGNICPHAAGPIGEGFLDGCVVECPWHAGRWDITTGKALTALATADIPLFEVRVVDEDIEIRLHQGALSPSALQRPGSG